MALIGKRPAATPAPTPEPVSAAATDEIEFMRLMAGRGWLIQHKFDVVCSFLRSKELYGEINKLIRKQR